MLPQRRGALARLQFLDNWIVAANGPSRMLQRLPPSRNYRATSRIPAANTLDRSQLQTVRFRGDFPAASLKHRPHGFGVGELYPIPRGLPRGLIEAADGNAVGADGIRIPRGLPRSLIEA